MIIHTISKRNYKLSASWRLEPQRRLNALTVLHEGLAHKMNFFYK